jgi:hypothetical protein
MRYQLVPIMVFICGVFAVVHLWGLHIELPNGIGAVKALRLDIVSPVDGVMIDVTGPDGKTKRLDMFDSVSAGDMVVKFDDSQVSATIATLQAEIKQLSAQLLATDAEMKQEFADRRSDMSDRRQSLLDDARRLAVDLEEKRLDVADRTIELESDRIAVKRRAEKLAIVKDLVQRKLETPYVLVDTQLQHDVQAKEIVEQEKALTEAKAMLVKAEARMTAFDKMIRDDDVLNKAQDGTETLADSIKKEIDIYLKPIEAAIATQQARIQEAEIQRKALVICVPSSLFSQKINPDGEPATATIMEVYRRPGQAVRAGEPIMRIANSNSLYIVSYVRKPHLVYLAEDSIVGVQVRTGKIRGAEATIARIGPQIESVPSRQLRDPRVPEWGLPVKIAVPPELKLKPGELVNITYKAAP